MYCSGYGCRQHRLFIKYIQEVWRSLVFAWHNNVEYLSMQKRGCVILVLMIYNKGLNSTCLFLVEVWSDRGSTCKFRNLHVYPLSLHTSMRNKQVEFNPYMYTLTTLPNCTVLATKYPFLIQNTRSLFYGRHYSSLHRLMSLHGKLNVNIFLMFIVAENTGSVNILYWSAPIVVSI